MVGPHQGLGDVGQRYISMCVPRPQRALLSEAAALRVPQEPYLGGVVLFSFHL